MVSTNPRNRITLNEMQAQAASALIGPVLIEGGPGTGESLTLDARAVELLLRRVPSVSIFRLNLSVRALAAMRYRFPNRVLRLTEHVSLEAINGVKHFTINGFANAWIKYCMKAASGVDPEYRVMTREGSEEMMRQLVQAKGQTLGATADDVTDIMRWNRFHRSTVQHMLPKVPTPGIPPLWDELIALFNEEKQRQNLLDMDDLVPEAVRVSADYPNFLEDWRTRLRPHLLVDDFQNVTDAEQHFLQLMAGRRGSLALAADSNQAIGSLRGAESRPLERFKRENQGRYSVTLETGYRQSDLLYRISRQLSRQGGMIPLPAPTARVIDRRQAGEALLAEFSMETGEQRATVIVPHMKTLHDRGMPWNDMAILCRRHSSVDQLLPMLNANRIPYTVLGEDRQQGLTHEPEALTVSTFHASVGRQWEHVHIIDAEDDIIPGRIEEDVDRAWEEKRLFYVAVTRAAKSLYISYSHTLGTGRMTRFLEPVREHFQFLALG